MEMWSASGRSKRDKKEIAAYIRGALAAIICSDGEVHASLSQKIERTLAPGETPTTWATGEMTLTVSWTTGDYDKSGAIDEESFNQIAKEVEEEMGYSRLTDAPHGEFALRVVERYITEIA